MPEVKVDLDKQGRVSGAHVVENTESHQIIEEFMLAANEAVAELLRPSELALPAPHPPAARPAEAQGADRVRRRTGLQDREPGRAASSCRSSCDQVAGRPEQHAVNYAALRSMQRAVYSPEEEGHYALASDCYCHFTSPIRRYPDLTVHRLIDARPRRRQAAATTSTSWSCWAHHCSRREQRAEAAERELTKLKLLHYLSERIGEEMDAVVTGVESFGLFVQGIELPAEGLIHVDSLQDDYYRFDRAAHTLSGHRSGNTFRLGDLLRVAVARVDLERRELDFRLVVRKKASTASDTTPKKGRQKGGRAVETPPQKGRQKGGRAAETPPQKGRQKGGATADTPPQRAPKKTIPAGGRRPRRAARQHRRPGRQAKKKKGRR